MPDGLKFVQGKVLSGRIYPTVMPIPHESRVLNLGCGLGPQAIVYEGQFELMVGVEIQTKRLRQTMNIMAHHGIDRFVPLAANVEELPLRSGSFDQALAIDIIEHIEDPRAFCLEAYRMLKDDGQFLVTFPTMHDRYVSAFSWVNRNILRRQSKGGFKPGTTWDPDSHNQEMPINEWLALVESCGFRQVASRASTLFPPLHLYGVPRFWFSNRLIHALDSFFARQPILKNYGQGLVVLFEKRAPGA